MVDKAPFSFTYRVLLIMFFPVWYLYPAISRCYCLIPLAVVLMAIYYKDRKDNPKPFLLSLIFLANTHVIMFGMVGIVLLDYLVELLLDIKKDKGSIRTIKNKRKALKSRKENKEVTQKRAVWFGITVFMLLLSILPLLGCLSTNISVKQNVEFIEGLKYMFTFWPIGLIRQGFILDLMSTSFRILTTWIICFSLVIALVLEMKTYLGAYLRILASVIYQLLIYAFIYYGSAQRAATIIFIVLYYKWIEYYKNRDIQDNKGILIVKICYMILILASVLGGLLFISNEVTCKSSYAYEMGSYINNNLPQNSIILSANKEEFTSSIIPYAPKNIKYYNIAGGRYFTYATWDWRNYIAIGKEDIEYLKQIFNCNDNLYYLHRRKNLSTQNELMLITECIDKGVFTEVYATKQGSYYDEDYVLYKVMLN